MKSLMHAVGCHYLATFLIHFVKDYVRTIRENWNPVDLAEEQQASFDRRFRTKSRANAKV
jgi:hypothetical protein